jgi:hypothetical protein
MPRPSLHPSKRATGSTPRRRDPGAATGRRGAHEPLRSPYSSRSRVDLTAARAAFARGLGLAMKRKGWSISETARQTSSALGGTTKFSTGHLWHYLHERALPRHAYLEALSRALDAPLRELLGAEHMKGGASAGASNGYVHLRDCGDGTALLQVAQRVSWTTVLKVTKALRKPASP